MSEASRWRVEPNTKVRLKDHDPDSTAGAPGEKEEITEEALPELQREAGELQDRLWAEAKRSVLVVLQAMDAGGKDGTIKHVFTGLNPQATRVAAFKEPTPIELAHDFLWRVHAVVPKAGEMTVFNRSHYEDVVIVRVHELVPEPVWRARYELINEFEALLASAGTTVVKFFLHISKDEQERRFQARLDSPDKRWKFRTGDLEERERWDDYQVAYEEAITKTSTAAAPWYVIPANHKWYRNWAVSTVLAETLRNLDPQYPQTIDD